MFFQSHISLPSPGQWSWHELSSCQDSTPMWPCVVTSAGYFVCGCWISGNSRRFWLMYIHVRIYISLLFPLRIHVHLPSNFICFFFFFFYVWFIYICSHISIYHPFISTNVLSSLRICKCLADILLVLSPKISVSVLTKWSSCSANRIFIVVQWLFMTMQYLCFVEQSTKFISENCKLPVFFFLAATNIFLSS